MMENIIGVDEKGNWRKWIGSGWIFMEKPTNPPALVSLDFVLQVLDDIDSSLKDIEDVG